MKKIYALLLILATVFVLVGCNKGPNLEIAEEDKTVEMEIGDTYEVPFTITEGFDLKWESDDPEVVEVNKGKLTAVGEGETVVKVSVIDSDVEVVINVTVTVPDPANVLITGVGIVVVGETLQLYANVYPTGAVQTVTWDSGNDEIATIDEEGNVTGVKAGTVTITATSTSDDIKDSKEITVVNPDPTGVTVGGAQEVALGSTSEYTATVAPTLASQDVVWSVSDEEVATIDGEGVLTPVKTGVVTVIATSITDDSIFGEIEVTIVLPAPTEITVEGEETVNVGNTSSYSVVVLPENASKEVTWSVDNEEVATIDEEGKLTPLKTGTVKVKAVSVLNESVFDELEVTINYATPTSLVIDGEGFVLLGNTASYTATVEPELALQEVTWSVDNDEVATIDEDGILTPIKTGTVKVKAISKALDTILSEIEVEILSNDYLLVDADLKDKESGEIVTENSKTFIVGATAFAKIEDLNSKMADGTTVYVKDGTYTGTLTIDKNNVSIYGPNKNIDPNLVDRYPEAVLTGKVRILANVTGFEFNGFKLTSTGKIEGAADAGIDGVTISYLYVNETAVDPSQGIIHFQSTADDKLNKNIVISNSFFDTVNSDSRMVRISNVFNLTIKDNVFLGGFDIIRLSGTNDSNTSGPGICGEFVVDNNYFTGAKQFVMFIVRYDFSSFALTNNEFENMAGQYYGGILDARAFNDQVESVEVQIKYNTFKDVFDWHLLRFTSNDRTIDTWKAYVNYNAFLTTPNSENLMYVSIKSTPNNKLANVEFNYFADNDGVKLTPDATGFNNVSSYANAFETLDDLMLSIELDKLSGRDDVILVGSTDIEVGNSLYATLAEALAAANEGDTIYLLPGAHVGDVKVSKNDITITSLNGNNNPNEEFFRFVEATYNGKITLASQLKGFEISGIKFIEQAQILNELGPAGTASAPAKNLDGFKFNNNIVETALASGKGFIYFVEAASSYSYDLEFNNNYFTTLGESALDSAVYIDNHNNLTLVGNVFENVVKNAFYINDKTKGTSGVTLVEGNTFKNVGGSAFWANWISPLPGDTGEIKVVNNVFENIGEYGVYLGKMNNSGDVYSEISVQYNKFTNIKVGVYMLRVHANAHAQINYNKFMDVASLYYVQNATDSSTVGPVRLNAKNNLYLNAGEVITPATDKFSGDIDFTTVYESEDDVPVYAGDDAILVTELIISEIEEDLYVGDDYQLELTYLPENTNTLGVVWESSDTNVATVDSNGKLKIVGTGSVTITVTSTSNPSVKATIALTVAEYQSVEIRLDDDGIIEVDEELTLTASLFPANASAEILFSSKNPAVATVTEEGVVTGVSEGTAIIEAKYGEVGSSIVIIVKNESSMENDPIQFIMDANFANVLARDITTFGNTNKIERTYGAVSKLWFNDILVNEKINPEGVSRPGDKLTSLEFIVVHDTGNNNIGANAESHYRFLTNSNQATSWHYTVDDEGAYHHLPNDEVGYHAGDGLREFGLNDTGVTATTPKPIITISQDGYYEINGTKSTIIAPTNNGTILTTADITPSGIFTTIGNNGNYYINNTYYNTSYKKISNHGGGANGIGIETAVDEGSDLYATWQNLAKLVAKLLVEGDLGLDRVMQHNNFSGKNCPQTLRTANLWDHFMEMVTLEYKLLTVYSDYTFTFQSNNPDILNDSGKIIKQPKITTEVSYTVTITNNDGYNESVTLYSIVPGSITI